MYIISVSPISKGIKAEKLSYWHKEPIEKGRIVTVPIRNKTTKGIVLDCVEAKNLKSEIRTAEFALKKIRAISKNNLFGKEFIEACKETADYYVSNVGSILNSITPSAIYDEVGKINSTSGQNLKSGAVAKGTGKFILQSPNKERFQDYKSIIRNKFAKNSSVFFCVPTFEDVEVSFEKLSKGIEKNTYCLHGRITPKEMILIWNQILKNPKPVLIIATGIFLGIPRHDLGAVIVESENSSAYKTLKRPYFDIRRFAEYYASALGIQIFFGDLMLRSETLKRYDEHEFFEFNPIKFRLVTTSTQKLINTKKENNPNSGKFSLFSLDLWRMILDGREESRKTFLLISRKGLATSIVCGDCGNTIMCENCDSPMVLYESKGEKINSMRCRKCGAIKDAEIRCRKCDGWRLLAFGAGIETAVREIKEKIGDKEIFIFDKDHIKTQLQAKKIITQFYESPAPIMVGTEMALFYLKEEIDNVGIISVDAMFSLPDYQIKERVMNMMMQAKSLARENFIVQTRNSDNKIFGQLMDGNLADFYRQEFIERKKYNYPPFSLLIKISASNSRKEKLEKDFEELVKYFSPEEFIYYPNFTEKIRGQFIMNGLIKLDKDRWPDPVIAEKLKGLPPNFSVTIDALSIL